MVLETISRIIKIQLPAYLKKLPLPDTIGGFARLTGKLSAVALFCLFCKDDFNRDIADLYTPASMS